MRAALDTNVLVYAEGFGDAARCAAALRLLEQLPAESVVLPLQVLGELARVLVAKAGQPADAARSAVLSWADSFVVVDSSWPALQAALDLVVDHGLGQWDALILAVAANSGCRLLLTEDLQAGFTWGGVTVVNPFVQPTDPLLLQLLGGGDA